MQGGILRNGRCGHCKSTPYKLVNTLKVELGERSYPILLGCGLLGAGRN